jgi:hypothetical protein
MYILWDLDIHFKLLSFLYYFTVYRNRPLRYALSLPQHIQNYVDLCVWLSSGEEYRLLRVAVKYWGLVIPPGTLPAYHMNNDTAEPSATGSLLARTCLVQPWCSKGVGSQVMWRNYIICMGPCVFRVIHSSILLISFWVTRASSKCGPGVDILLR